MRKASTWPSIENHVEIYEDDVKHKGTLLKQSMVIKMWKRRWCVVTSQYLCSFKREDDYRNPTERLTLSECLSVRSADNEIGKENSFCVVSEQRTFYLIASSAEEKETWTAAIMNSLLPELASRGLRRSLTLFSIGEQDEEEDEDEWLFSPRKLLKSFLSSKSSSSSPSKIRQKPSITLDTTNTTAPSTSLAEGDGRIPSQRRPSLTIDTSYSPNDTRTPTLQGEQYPFRESECSNCSSSQSRSSSSNTPKTPFSTGSSKTPRRVRSVDHLLDVVGDEILISPHALPSLRLSTPRGMLSPISRQTSARARLDSVEEEVAATFDEAMEAWQERFQVGEKVRARDYEVQAWVEGVVTCSSPLKVMPLGKSKGHSFQHVQRTAEQNPLDVRQTG